MPAVRAFYLDYLSAYQRINKRTLIRLSVKKCHCFVTQFDSLPIITPCMRATSFIFFFLFHIGCKGKQFCGCVQTK